VSGAPSPQLFAKAHTNGAGGESLATWEGEMIGSRFEPYTFHTRSRKLTTCSIWLNLEIL